MSEYSDEEIGGLGSGPRYPLRSTEVAEVVGITRQRVYQIRDGRR